jgi:hypothetical protein
LILADLVQDEEMNDVHTHGLVYTDNTVPITKGMDIITCSTCRQMTLPEPHQEQKDLS